MQCSMFNCRLFCWFLCLIDTCGVVATQSVTLWHWRVPVVNCRKTFSAASHVTQSDTAAPVLYTRHETDQVRYPYWTISFSRWCCIIIVLVVQWLGVGLVIERSLVWFPAGALSLCHWPFGTLKPMSHAILGVAYKNLAKKSDFSHMPPSRSGFDYERRAFRSDWSDQSDFWLWMQPRLTQYTEPNFLLYSVLSCVTSLGTVQIITETMNAVILPKCRVFAMFFCQNAVVLRFHKNILFLF